ncbi:elongation of very long chain fatty acids protein, putative [Pediculus humanus corporis]|uniref:Elongation of very long chain fatty acids protein n=1 Tax=Pediculus humanus subsp. corporis TaxID=121224 RepID=E0VU32_PEDHC|nr:elongation of very long chain fatty acids protein, putative [Pediculus humanus corporis]EEB16888.1 elongation of very long chain fatty acids protein, putative [Pediculus humanus corporis]
MVEEGNMTYADFLTKEVVNDPRVENLLLMKNPFPIAGICAAYVYFVLHLGPKFMTNRKPYNLKNIIIIYNAAQSIFSAVMFYEAVSHWYNNYGFLECIPVNFNLLNPIAEKEIRLCHLYFLSKITELLDTIFFVLKKKDRHVSLLHVFHHAAMPFSVWFGVKFHPGGNLAFFGIPNLFVHIWMYFYYMMAAMGPQYQKYIWWKRHITQMQLAQFAIVMIYVLIISGKCTQNWHLVSWILVLDVAFVILFVDFYRKAYREKKDKKTKDVNDVTVEKTSKNWNSNNVMEDSKCNYNLTKKDL